MNAGAAAAKGDVILFLHADTILPDTAFDAIRNAVENGAAGGIFRLQFDRSTLLLRASSYATRFPLKSICFGDRAIFSTAEAFQTVGGFPDVPVFEDLEFTRRLVEIGPFHHLEASVVTSSRRFAARGEWRQQWLNTRLWVRYQMGADPGKLAREYRYPD
jgi:GT2 family glycosyltransferase